MDPHPGTGASSIEAVPWAQIGFGAPGGWVEAEVYPQAVPPKDGDHSTYLLWSRQVLAETQQVFRSVAVRLETPLAVQHQSQWRLDLDPRHQSVVLHWLRIVRGERVIDCMQRERMRLIQREAQLEQHVLDGSWTLLAVLDDVRVGDVVESSYTFTSRFPLRASGCEQFFPVPPQISIGHFRLSVRFAADRPGMRYKTSTDAPPVVVTTPQEGVSQWTWTGEQLNPRPVEPNQPGEAMDYIWIQVSDLDGWPTLAAEVGRAWEPTADLPKDLDGLSFAKPEVVDAAEVARLIRQIQDNFRYLSVTLDVGGWIPAAPSIVARRRYGDCKDLVWLAACALRHWGVKARPILVGASLRGEVTQLLPIVGAFNHAVLEVSVDGHARWFDLTLRQQGGNYATMAVPWFGRGLPVEPAGSDLIEQPGAQGLRVFALSEIMLLDTRKGHRSLVERRVLAEGEQADFLRSHHLSEGADRLHNERLEEAKSRFGKVHWSTKTKWRDDRAANQFELVEVFEVEDTASSAPNDRRAIVDLPPNLVQAWFGLPAENRRTAWDMPYPFELRHRLEVRHRSMGRLPDSARSWQCEAFRGLLQEIHEDGVWSKTTWMSVHLGQVPTAQFATFRSSLAKFGEASSWRLFLPWSIARPEVPAGWGVLPEEKHRGAAYVAPADPRVFTPADAMAPRPPFSLSPGARRVHIPGIGIGLAVLVLMNLLRQYSTPQTSSQWSPPEPVRQLPSRKPPPLTLKAPSILPPELLAQLAREAPPPPIRSDAGPIPNLDPVPAKPGVNYQAGDPTLAWASSELLRAYSDTNAGKVTIRRRNGEHVVAKPVPYTNFQWKHDGRTYYIFPEQGPPPTIEPGDQFEVAGYQKAVPRLYRMGTFMPGYYDMGFALFVNAEHRALASTSGYEIIAVASVTMEISRLENDGCLVKVPADLPPGNYGLVLPYVLTGGPSVSVVYDVVVKKP